MMNGIHQWFCIAIVGEALSLPLTGHTPLRVRCERIPSTYRTPSVSPFGLPAFSSGMIATGNHNFERFAALCNTPKGAPRALRAGVCPYSNPLKYSPLVQKPGSKGTGFT